MKYIRAAFALLLYLSITAVFAQAVPVPRVVFPITPLGNVINIGAATADAANAASFSFGAAANGSLYANASQYVPTAGGKSILIAGSGNIPKANLAKALLAGGRLVPLLQTGIAVFDLLNDFGVFGQRMPDGSTNYSGYKNVTELHPTYVFNDSGAKYPSANQTCVANWGATGRAVFPTGGDTPGNSFDCWVDTNPSRNSYHGGTRVADQILTYKDIRVLSDVEATNLVNTTVVNASISPHMDAGVKQALSVGQTLDIDAPTVTGPATQTVSQNSTADPVNNTTATQTVTNNYAYAGNTITTSQVTNNVTTNNSTGAVVNNSTVTNSTPVTPKDVIVCGLPNTPACLINETGTPQPVADGVYNPKLDTFKTNQGSLKDTAAGTSDKAFFQGWASVFVTPPITTCTGYVLPQFKGVGMGTIDPCPVVDGVRAAMAYIWAVSALFFAVRMVREVV